MSNPKPTHDQIREILSKMPEFNLFAAEQLARLARMPLREWDPDKEIIEEGLGGETPMIVLLAGTVKVNKRVEGGGSGYERINEINAPTIIGENAFFTRLPRSVSILAGTLVHGLVIEREDFLKLSSLKQVAILEFFKKMGNENLKRVEQILDRLLNSLQMTAGEVTKKDLIFFQKMKDLETQFQARGLTLDGVANLVKEVFLLQRSANDSLEELFHFANLEELVVVDVEPSRFRLPETHEFHSLFKKLLDQILEAQGIIPLEKVLVKNLLVQILLGEYRSRPRFDFSYFIRNVVNSYKFLQTNPQAIGLQVRSPSHTPMSSETHYDL